MYLLQTGGYTALQTAFAVAVLLGIFVGLAIVKARLDFAGLSERYRRHLHAVRGDYLTTDPVTRRFDHDAVREGSVDVRAGVAELVAAAADGETVDQTHSIRLALADAWRDVTADLDRRILALGRLAVLIVVFAPLAVSTDAIVAALQTEPGGLTLAEAVSAAGESLGTLLETAVAVAGAFPFAGAVWTLLLTLVLIGGEWLYVNWYVIVGLLVVCALSLYTLDDAAVGPPETVRSRRWRVARLVGGLVIVWTTGTVPAMLGAWAGVDSVGAGVGIVAAVVVGGWLAYSGITRWFATLRRVDWRPAAADTPTIAYRLTRYVSLWTLVIAGPLAALYAGAAVVTGGLWAVVTAVLSAHPLVQTAVLVGLAAVGAVVGYLVRDHWDDIRLALRDTSVRGRVRAGLWLSGLPVVVGIFAYIGLTSMVELPIAALGAGVLVVLVRLGGRLLQHARYARSLTADDPIRHDPLVEVWVATDADGERQHLARISGTGVAHPDREAFLDAAVDAVRDVAHDGAVEPSVATIYFDRLTNHGIVNPDAMGLDETVRAAIFDALRGAGARDRESFRRELSDYPDAIVDQQLAAHQDCLYIDGDLIELRHDPYAPDEQQREGVRRPTA